MRALPSRVIAVVAGLGLIMATAALADPAADLMASLNKLSTLKYYKVKQSFHFDLTPEMQQQMEMAKSMGMDMGAMMPKGATTEYAPGLRRSTMPQSLPTGRGRMGPPQMVQANIISVARTGSAATPVVATYTDCKVCEENQDANVRESLERQAAMSATSVAREVVNAVAGGPAGIAAAVVNHAINNPATQAAMVHKSSEMTKDAMSLNRWKCRDVAASAATPQRTADKPPFQNVKYAGEQTVNGEQAKTYEVAIADPDTGKTYPVTFYTASKTGLPMKMEFKADMGQGMPGGSIAMEYYDFDVPNQIDVPDCLK